MCKFAFTNYLTSLWDWFEQALDKGLFHGQGIKSAPKRLGGHKYVSKQAWWATFYLKKLYHRAFLTLNTECNYKIASNHIKYNSGFFNLALLYQMLQISEYSKKIYFKGHMKKSWRAFFSPRAAVWPPLPQTMY